MDYTNPNKTGSSLLISSDVIAKIAQLAASEVEGVHAIAADISGAKGFVNKLAAQNPIRVEISDDVADIEVSVVAEYGTKIPELCEKIQSNVKTSVQNMTSISVAQVNVIVTGVVNVDDIKE